MIFTRKEIFLGFYKYPGSFKELITKNKNDKAINAVSTINQAYVFRTIKSIIITN